MRVIHRTFGLWVFVGLLMPFGLGYLIDGTLAGALTAALWGGPVRIFALHHVTWSINSVCHFFGTRRFEVEDHSTNVFWLSLLSFGESWHHNHHAFPRSARHGLRWWEIDPTAWLIRGMRRLRLAWNVVEITPGAPAAEARGRELQTCINPQFRAINRTDADRRTPPGDPHPPRARREGRRQRARRRRSACPTTRSGGTCVSWPPAGSCSACTAGRCRPRPPR